MISPAFPIPNSKESLENQTLDVIPGRSTGCRNHWDHRDHHHRCLEVGESESRRYFQVPRRLRVTKDRLRRRSSVSGRVGMLQPIGRNEFVAL